MSNWPFRFVHASDLQLQRMPSGLSDVPDHLRNVLIDAPYQAAELIFDTALLEEVDFVVLSGNVLDARATGPRGPAFLFDQFQRLAEQGILVYWAGGSSDQHDLWPGTLNLPSNVHLFPQGRMGHFIHQRNGQPVVKLIGTSFQSQNKLADNHQLAKHFNGDESNIFTIAVYHDKLDTLAMEKQSISYWALGGSPNRQTLSTSPSVFHFPGTPQARSANETGLHGCTVVKVDEFAKVRSSFAALDSVRWHTECLEITTVTDRKTLEHQLRVAAETIARDSGGTVTLIKWVITGSGACLKSLREGELADQLLNWLRAEFGHQRPIVWSLKIDTESDSVLPAKLYEQETILGDFLRIVRSYQEDVTNEIELNEYLDECYLAGTIASNVDFQDPNLRHQVLQEASQLGVDLLSGDQE